MIGINWDEESHLQEYWLVTRMTSLEGATHPKVSVEKQDLKLTGQETRRLNNMCSN